MSYTREALVAQLVSDLNTAVMAAYSSLSISVGATRDLPGDETDETTIKTRIPAESTPIVYVTEGSEEHVQGGNGIVACRLTLRLAGIVKRREGVEGQLHTHCNRLLAVIQGTVWPWTYSGATIETGGPAETYNSQDWAGCAENVVLCFRVPEGDP